MLAVVPAGVGELMQVSWRAFAGLPVCLRSGVQVQMCRCVCRCKLVFCLFAAVHIVQMCKCASYWCAGTCAQVTVHTADLWSWLQSFRGKLEPQNFNSITLLEKLILVNLEISCPRLRLP